MKNISRRVFIKGLAVAGVAAAASTVLAGCNTNMIPGVDDGKDDTETPEAPVTTITFTDPDNSSKTLTIVSKSFALGQAVLGQDKTATIEFQVDNKLAQSGGVAFIDAATDLTATDTTSVKNGETKIGSYYVKVSAYADGNDRADVTLASDAEIWASDASGDNFVKDKVATKKLSFDVSDIKKSVTIKMAFMELEAVATTGSGSAFHPVVRQIGDAKEFTYTL